MVAKNLSPSVLFQLVPRSNLFHRSKQTNKHYVSIQYPSVMCVGFVNGCGRIIRHCMSGSNQSCSDTSCRSEPFPPIKTNWLVSDFAIHLYSWLEFFFRVPRVVAVRSVCVIYTVRACVALRPIIIVMRFPEPGVMTMTLKAGAAMWWPLINF